VELMRRFPCCICSQKIARVRESDGNPILIDPEPVEHGPLVLISKRSWEPSALHGVSPGGDEFWGIAAGEPRYQKHDCRRGA
jgi:hypothetical protein